MCSHVSAAVSEPVTAAIPPMGSLLSAEFPDPPVAAGESRASEVAGAGSMTPPSRVRAQRAGRRRRTGREGYFVPARNPAMNGSWSEEAISFGT